MTATGIKITHLISRFDFGKEVIPVEILIVRIVDLMGNVTGNCDEYGKLKKTRSKPLKNQSHSNVE